MQQQIWTPVIWVGGFNAHNLLCGRRMKDNNGNALEEFMDRCELICLNDSRLTRFDVGIISCTDLALPSSELA